MINRLTAARGIARWTILINKARHRFIVIYKVLEFGCIIEANELDVEHPRHLVWCLIETLDIIRIRNLRALNKALNSSNILLFRRRFFHFEYRL